MEPGEAVMRCMACGAIMEVVPNAAVIAGEAYWHRLVVHRDFEEVEFATRFPTERATGNIVIKSGGLMAEQAEHLAAWDTRIETMSFAA